MVSKGILKVIGVAVTIIGMGATLVSDWVDDLRVEKEIEEKINEILDQRNEEES